LSRPSSGIEYASASAVANAKIGMAVRDNSEVRI